MGTRGAAAESVQPLSLDAESRVFVRLRTTLTWALLRWMFTSARLRLGLVLLLSCMFWGTLFVMFIEGFRFIDVMHAEVISLLFNAFCSSLMVMLVFSAGILVYSGLYCTSEARLLLTLPARPETVFAHQFQEAIWFSSWGFLLLGSPMLAAYGVVRQASWVYYAMLLPFMLSFVVIPAAVGAIACMLIVVWLPRLRLHAVSLAGGGVCLLVAWLGWTLFGRGGPPEISPTWFVRTISRLSITEQKMLPSWWLSSGLIEAARVGRHGVDSNAAAAEAGKFLALLVANAMFLQLVAGWIARAVYLRGYSGLVGETRQPRRRPTIVTSSNDAAVGRPMLLLLAKDWTLFRRDVSQWSQFAIFAGLMALYFFNLRAFQYTAVYAAMIGYLNLAVVGLILATFTTRFVFPMISLEGRRFWILGLLPVHRDQIMWSKFVFSVIGTLIPCAGLVLLSASMLGLRWRIVLQHEFCCLVLCLGLSGIAVGLGARIPELRESSPAKISSGFGGTLCLVVSSLFILVVVVSAAVPAHARMVMDTIDPSYPVTNLSPGLQTLLVWTSGTTGWTISLAIAVLAGVTATLLPLRLGMRTFRRLEL